jgi:hypothetical protein
MPVDYIRYLIGDLSNDPIARRAYELAEKQWRERASTQMDGSAQPKAFLDREAARLREADEAGLFIDAIRKGQAFGVQRPEYPERGRATHYSDGTTVVDLYDDENSYEAQARREGRPFSGSPEVTGQYDKTGRTYGDVTQHPGYNDDQDRKARIAAHKSDPQAGYIVGAQPEGTPRNLIPADDVDPGGMYGRVSQWPSRDAWRGKFK